MSGWILNIVGMVFIGVILEVVLPSGKTNAVIKSVFAIFLLYVIVSPLPKLFNKDLSVSNSSTINLDINYLINLNLNKIKETENSIVSSLKQNGYENVSAIVSANIYQENFTVTKIHLDITKLVLKKSDKHININEDIKNIVIQLTNIKGEDIVIYE